jgi:hypothetical protein
MTKLRVESYTISPEKSEQKIREALAVEALVAVLLSDLSLFQNHFFRFLIVSPA